MLEHKFVPGFKSKLHHKDMHIVQDTAQELNIQFPVTEMVTAYLDELMFEQKGELDSSAILLILEKITGVSLR